MKSPLGIPCKAPPYGTLSAIDLTTGKRIWRRPAGTLEDTVLHGVTLSAPIPIGMPTMGGPTSTAGGLVFYAGTVDFYLRAFDVRNGRELWKSRLPAGNQGGVITYTTAKSGRQFVALTAGGARESPVRGDYVIAYALPEPSGAKH
jgi:quinate dehydrogenase (quinone)